MTVTGTDQDAAGGEPTPGPVQEYGTFEEYGTVEGRGGGDRRGRRPRRRRRPTRGPRRRHGSGSTRRCGRPGRAEPARAVRPPVRGVRPRSTPGCGSGGWRSCRDQGRRRLRWVVGAVTVLVLVVVALLVLHTPLVAVRHTTVVGATHTGVEPVLAAAGLTANPPLIDVNPSAAAARVEALPWVAHAVVARHWPDAVTVTVTERVPLGTLARPGGGVALVDRTGRVLAGSRTAGADPVAARAPRSPRIGAAPRRPACAGGGGGPHRSPGRTGEHGGVAADGSVTLGAVGA